MHKIIFFPENNNLKNVCVLPKFSDPIHVPVDTFLFALTYDK